MPLQLNTNKGRSFIRDNPFQLCYSVFHSYLFIFIFSFLIWVNLFHPCYLRSILIFSFLSSLCLCALVVKSFFFLSYLICVNLFHPCYLRSILLFLFLSSLCSLCLGGKIIFLFIFSFLISVNLLYHCYLCSILLFLFLSFRVLCDFVVKSFFFLSSLFLSVLICYILVICVPFFSFFFIFFVPWW